MLNYLNNNLSSEIIAIINHFYAVSICIFIIYLFLLWMAEVNNSASGSQTSLPTSPNSSGADPEDPEEKKTQRCGKEKTPGRGVTQTAKNSRDYGLYCGDSHSCLMVLTRYLISGSSR